MRINLVKRTDLAFPYWLQVALRTGSSPHSTPVQPWLPCHASLNIGLLVVGE